MLDESISGLTPFGGPLAVLPESGRPQREGKITSAQVKIGTSRELLD